MYEFTTEVNTTRWILASLLTALALGAFALLARYYAQGRHKFVGKNRRMKLVETLHLDSKHKVCLVRLDKAEHMLLIGSSGEALLHSQMAKDAEDNESGVKNTNPDKEIGFLKNLHKGGGDEH